MHAITTCVWYALHFVVGRGKESDHVQFKAVRSYILPATYRVPAVVAVFARALTTCSHIGYGPQ